MTATRLTDLPTAAREMAVASIAWLDGFWDDEAGLVWQPGVDPQAETKLGVQPHLVRESTWYALGLLMRDAAGDRERAGRALEVVLAHQFDTPEQVYHGTFRRAPEEPLPPAEPREWRDYDPNWREFIGTTLAIILQEYEDQLPGSLVTGIDRALRLAVAGTLARNVRATYTNIALMCAFLLDFAADRFGVAEWRERGEALGAEIYRLFREHDTFEEYNSPTYYGVDLYALALWRSRAPSPRLREFGADMEARLWRDIARYYHAGLRNIAGPYDRSYGMDLRRYAAILGLWVWTLVGDALKPFPDPDRPFDHTPDFSFAPCVAILGARAPGDALPHFTAFRGERQIEQVITTSPRRVATAWIGHDLMLGGQYTSGSKRASYQFIPATVHWRAGNEVGWLKLVHTQPVDVRVDRTTMTITAAGQEGAEPAILTFHIAAPGIAPDALTAAYWRLPGLTVQVETNAEGPVVTRHENHVEARYTAREAAKFVLRMEAVERRNVERRTSKA